MNGNEIFFINGHYLKNDDENYLVKCSYEDGQGGTGRRDLKKSLNSRDGNETEEKQITCKPYATTGVTGPTVEFFIYGESTGLTKAILKVTLPAAGGSRKRQTQTSTITFEIIDGNEDNIYINASNGKLIQCYDEGCSAFESTGTSTIPAYYVNAAATDSDYTDDIIICTASCIEYKDDTKPVSENNVFLNGNLKGTTNGATDDTKIENVNGSTEQLIVCSENKCVPVAVEVDNGKAKYYINSGDSANVLIQCLYDTTETPTTKCEAINLTSFDTNEKSRIYLNGNWKDTEDSNFKGTDDTNRLIRCSSNTSCDLTSGTVEQGKYSEGVTSNYYVNSGSISETKLTDSLIECTGTSCDIKQGLNSIVNDSITEIFFVNSDYGDEKNDKDELIQDDTNYLIKCTKNEGCTAYANSSTNEAGDYYYIHGGNDGFENAVIKVTLSSGAGTRKRKEEREVLTTVMSEVESDFFINNEIGEEINFEDNVIIDKEKEMEVDREVNSASLDDDVVIVNIEDDNDVVGIASDLTATFTLLTPVANNIYLNASTDKKLIQCQLETGKEAGNCLSIDAKGSAETYAYYLNADAKKDITTDGNGNDLIECNEKCDYYNSAIENKVFVNSNYYDVSTNLNGDKEKQLIICYKNESNNYLCSAKASTITEANSVEYYSNAGDGSTNSPLITCKKETANDEVNCTIGTITLSDNIKQVYLNGNFKKNDNNRYDTTNHLLVCSSDECTQTPYTSSISAEYYINSGAISNTKLTDTLILCDSDGCIIRDVSNEISATITEVFFINKGYHMADDDKYDSTNYLIKCDATDGCISYKNEATTDNGSYYYVHGIQTDFTDALIECKLETTGGAFSCGFLTTAPKATDIFINSFNKNIIQCYTESEKGHCASIAGSGSEGVPIYYKNSADSTSENFKSLIKCTGVGTCEPFDGTENGVYINSNYKTDSNTNGDSTYQLIICTDTTSCDLKTATEGAYYINSGITSTTSYDNLLIDCPGSGACQLSSGGEDEVYLNGNYKDTDNTINTDTTNKLIICNDTSGEKKCEGQSGIASSGNDYYVNSGSRDSNPLVDTLIQCSTTECKAYSLLDTVDGTNISEVFFINKNYGTSNDPDNYLIKCDETNGCVGYKNNVDDDGNYYYVHGIQTGFADALIECTFSNKQATCTFYSTPSATNIFINSYNNNVIQCYGESGSESCASITGSGTDDVPIYYKNTPIATEDDLKKLLIKCTGVNSCYLSDGSENGVYINSNYITDSNTNGDDTNQLIICDKTSKACNLKETEANAYYVNAGVSPGTSYNNLLISCPDENSECTPADGGEDYVYLNGNYKKSSDASSVYTDSTNQLIICNETDRVKKCEPQSGTASSTDENDYYVNNGSYDTDPLKDTLIECTSDSDGCTVKSLENVVTGDVKEVFFKNKNYGTDKDPVNYLIYCSSETSSKGCKPYGTQNPNLGDVEHYIHGSPDNTTKTDKAIIKVTFSDGQTGNVRKRATTVVANPEIINGVATTGIYINSFNNELIQCISECKAISNTGTDNKPKYYINADLTDNENYKDLLIKCSTTDKCKLMNGHEFDVYINSNFDIEATKGDNENQLIVCQNDSGAKKCSPKKVETLISQPSDHSIYYRNSGKFKDDNNNDNAMIECKKDDTNIICEPKLVVLGSGTPNDVFYINANKDVDSKYLIRCTTVSNCGIYSNENIEENSVEYYVHGDQQGLTDAIIQCTGDNNNSAECIFVTTPVAGYVYINSSGGNLIQCHDTRCDAFNGVVGSTSVPAYYVNGDGDGTSSNNYTGLLIKCEGAGKCADYDDGDENKVFINSNYKDPTITENNPNNNGDGKRLIICSSNKCETKDSSVSGESNYYLNSGVVNPESSSYASLLIRCRKEGACILANGATNNVYLNGNYKNSSSDSISTDNTNPLIICSSNKCELNETQLSTDGSEYYANAGKYRDETSQKTYALIICKKDSSATPSLTCNPEIAKIGNGTPNDVFYMNANKSIDKKYLIQCTSEDSCTIYSNIRAIKDLTEYYVHGGQTKFDDAIITCTISNVNPDRTVDATCAFETNVAENYTYINSSGGNLIQCTKIRGTDGGCDAFSGVVGSRSMPAYFINGKGESSDTTYTGLLIKCTGSGLCENFDGTKNGIYVNSNYKNSTMTTDNPNPNGDTSYRLISCNNTGNGKCEGIDNAVTTGYDFYLNTGAVVAISSTYTDLLVRCPQSGPCTVESGGEDNVYLNGNKATDGNKLIYCNNKECTLLDGLAKGTLDEYYVNAGASSESKLSDTLIKCSTSDCALDTTVATKITTTVTELFYINKNFSPENDPVNYVIKCSSTEGCVPYGNNKFKEGTVEHYVHGAQTKIGDAIIKVSLSSTSSKNKRATVANTGPTVELLSTAVADDIYLNSYTKKLIQCKNSGCNAYASTGEKDKPVYYVNAEVKTSDTFEKLLIQCEDTCEEASGKANDVYLNGNFASTTNANGDTVNHLIICANKSCTPTANAVDTNKYEYYVNAGAFNEKPLVDTLIKCSKSSAVSCTTKDVSDLVDGTKVVDTFFLNKNYNEKADTNYLIQCTKEGGCQPYSSGKEENSHEYYVHGGKTTPLDDTLIQCEIKNKKATCTTDKATTLVADKQIYLNSAHPEQIIRCTTSDGCIAVTSEPTEKQSEYYMNGDDATGKNLIKCSKSDGCQVITEEINSNGNNVFMNANAKETLDTENPLIKCSKGVCALGASQADTNKPEYYQNSDPTYTDPLKNDLILCSKEKDNITCKATNAKANDVYLNADYEAKVNKKPLIICTSDAGCVESVTTSTATNFVYYINAGHTATDLLTDTLIECGEECDSTTANNTDIYINGLEMDHGQLIQCTTEKGCIPKKSNASVQKKEIYLNASDLKKDTEVTHANDLIICTQEQGNTNTIKCKPSNGETNGIYINAAAPGQIIQCLEGKICSIVPLQVSANGAPVFYVNGDPMSSALSNDLIKCRSSGGKVTCDTLSGKDGEVYLNGNSDGTNNIDPLIICTEKKGCIPVMPDMNESSLPQFYVNSGSFLPSRLNDTLIQCSYESSGISCSLQLATANEVYVNYGDNKDKLPLIKCQRNGCTASLSNAKENNNEYYLNSGDSNSDLLSDLIECTMSSENKPVTCSEMEETKEGIYMNANYVENGDNNQLIQCSKEKGCTGLRAASNSRIPEYYVNAESTTLENAIIYCVNKKCSKETPPSTPMYFVGTSEELNGLIECVGENAKKGQCSLKPAFTSSGYYLNSGYNKAINQTIICSAEEGCQTMKVNLGYYVNAGDASNPIIKCEKSNTECTTENVDCPISDEAALAGDYCYSNGQLKFYAQGNSTAIIASKSDDYYAYGTISSNKFPGITKDTSTLFKISRFFINQFFQSGVVIIDKNGKLLDSLGSDQTDINIYDCNENTKLCTYKPACTPYTYMYDSENKKALFCNEYKQLAYSQFTGYVIDGTRTLGTNHPYLIKCENNGEKCVTGRSKKSSYYENSGYDSATNKLIQCSNNHCETVAAEVGYYVGHDGAGIINCSSETSCTLTDAKLDTKYLNAGYDKVSHALIECTKKKGCSTKKAKSGNYLTYAENLLIDCNNPTNCFEFTPTANHYNNADVTSEKDRMINCEERGTSVSCKLEAGNDGFYVNNNKIVRCRNKSICKTVTILNGILHGAIPAPKSNHKRSDDESIEANEHQRILTNDQNRTDENVNDAIAMEDMEKTVNLPPRDTEEVYGVIRCTNGKCEALSPEELFAIPICEFNNKKCYITLEYAMMKSATTTISAGNICTNNDRSIFYFATDTVVVKPNVIAGVTSTYVYTTTNSNCLEVNDSYDNMYFTVGPNIYLLDNGSVIQFVDPGYFFINTATNTMVTSNSIEDYNDDKVKLYHCNGSSCQVMDKPESHTYFTDANKRIFTYNTNNNAYSFAYEKDIICIFSNNKCTPNADLNGREFCVTYKGEICLAKEDIKNRETGECYKSSSMTTTIYGYSQNLYSMTLNQAQMVDQTGYYWVSLSTNSTVQTNLKNFKAKGNSLVLYGCEHSNCKEYSPNESTYYYDERAKTMIRYKDGQWRTPSTSGYALVSLDPTTTNIYQFTMDQNTVQIENVASNGYHYTVDGEMYECSKEYEEGCRLIDNTGYYFTKAGEVYYCIYDSEGLEATECTRQSCVNGQYYYINEAYYRCESNANLLPVMSRHCSAEENVVMNFPVVLTQDYPDKVKQAMESIEKNNNSTAIISRRTKNYLASVTGIFTNCTYDVEETKSTFDMVCLNNYVTVDDENDNIKICSVEQLGYVECLDDDENPNKCHVSGSLSNYLRPSILSLIIITMIISFFTNRF